MDGLEWRRVRGCVVDSCVEVAHDGTWWLIRQSDVPDVVLRFNQAEWDAFVEGAEAGEFRFAESEHSG